MSERDIKEESKEDIDSDAAATNNNEAWFSRSNFATSRLFSTAQDNSEQHLMATLLEIRPETELCGSHEVVIKRELPYQNKVKEVVCELYADHEVKEELVLGPTVLQHPDLVVVLLQQPCEDVRGQDVNSGSTQCDTESRDRSGDKMCCDVKSAAHTCQDSDELWATASRAGRSHYARADSVRDKSLAENGSVRMRYECNVCEKKITLKCNLDSHMQTQERKRRYECNVCCSKFKRRCDLTQHIRKHTGEKPYKCDVCSKDFADRSSSNRHMRTHTGERPHKCDICGKTFTRKGHLSQHLRTHTGEKLYKCYICSKFCTQQSSLKVHMRIHTGQRPHKCNVCGKGFTRKGHLSQHMPTHTREKSYKCDVCSKLFPQQRSLKTHMQTHT